jgi:MFS family permease
MSNSSSLAPRVPITYLLLVTSVAAVGGFLFGYDISLISGAIIFLQQEWSLTPFWVGVVTGSAILGCPFGALAGVYLADRWGRNRSLILSAVLFLVSAIGTALPFGLLDFSWWRFVGGLGVGLASTVSPMYIAEISPAHLRGRMVVLNQLSAVVVCIRCLLKCALARVAMTEHFKRAWIWVCFNRDTERKDGLVKFTRLKKANRFLV